MTGICYFANDEVEYFAEQQVNSIVNNIDDGARLIRESESISPELVDNLIEEAAKQKCDKLVLMVESKKYHQYKDAIPKVYGDMFESIEVVPENFVRVQESNRYDYYDGMDHDVKFWHAQFCANVEARFEAHLGNEPDIDEVEWIAGKIDEEHPTDSPEQFESLMRWVRELLREGNKPKPALRENDTAARGAQSLPQNQTQQAQPQPQQTTKQQPFKDATSTTFVLCDAAHINAKKLNTFLSEAGKYKNYPNFKMSFTTVDSARLEGAALKSLLVEYPKKVANLETVAQQMSPDAPDFSLEADGSYTLQAFLQKAAVTTEKVKDANGNEVEQQVSTGSKFINIFAPPKQYQYLTNSLKNNATFAQSIRVFPLSGSYENENNQKINQLMEVLLNTDKELKCTGKEEDWVAAQKEGKNNLDMQFINYVRSIMKFMNEYANCDRRKPHDKAKRESELMKALKAQLMKWSGVDNAKKELSDNSAIAKFAIETFDKVKDAAKKDLQGNEKDKNKGMFDEKQAKDRNPKNIFMWEHYAELRKLLIEK